MLCMKCGREIEPEQVFCPECLAEMEKYPVKPGTVVQLPKHTPPSPVRKQITHRHTPQENPEEQIKKLKRLVAALLCALILSMATIVGLLYLGADHYWDSVEEFLPGQNYSSVTGPAEQK